MGKAVFAAIALILGGCVSTEVEPYVGRPIEDVFLAYGKPENVFDLPTGQRAFQYRWGGGSGIIPGASTTTAYGYGAVATTQTYATPSIIVESKGCLISFIGSPAGASFTVSEVRTPRQLVC